MDDQRARFLTKPASCVQGTRNNGRDLLVNDHLKVDHFRQGGFNWPSQHSAIMEVCDGSSSTVSRSCGSPGNEVPWFKTEAVGKNNPFHPGPFKSIADIEYATMGWVDWYNNRRLRSTLNNIPPAEFELNYYATHFASQPVISRT